jgi:hypothetical protein
LFNLDDYANASRPPVLTRSPAERRAPGQRFDEVEIPLDEHTVQEECKRCLRCDLEWLERIGEPLP